MDNPQYEPIDFNDMLTELLVDMDIPMQRRNDIGWLSRNLGVRNSKHPKFEMTMAVIKKIQKG